MTKTISQREARSLKRRVRDLEYELSRQRNAWADVWPGGVRIAQIDAGDTCGEVVRVSRKLGHAVVVTAGSDGRLFLYALQLGESK